jgi:hypothetical protein
VLPVTVEKSAALSSLALDTEDVSERRCLGGASSQQSKGGDGLRGGAVPPQERGLISDLRRDELPGEAEVTTFGGDVLTHPAQGVWAAGGDRPSDDASAAGAPDHWHPPPQQFADEAAGQVGVAVHDDCQHALQRHGGELFVCLMHAQASGADGCAGSWGCQVDHLGVRVGG